MLGSRLSTGQNKESGQGRGRHGSHFQEPIVHFESYVSKEF